MKWLHTQNVEVKVGWGVQTLHVPLHALLPPTCLLNHALLIKGGEVVIFTFNLLLDFLTVNNYSQNPLKLTCTLCKLCFVLTLHGDRMIQCDYL